jgi:hypothetical protein
MAALKDLRNHPAWKVYQDDILDYTICDIRDMLLNGVSGLNTAEEEVGFMKALRTMLQILVKLRDEPYRLLESASRMREEFGIASPEETE